MHTIEFFFDCSSPWTYLAFESIQDLAARDDVEMIWKPMLVGGIFNAVNPSVYENRAKPVPANARCYAKDLQDGLAREGFLERIAAPDVKEALKANTQECMDRGGFGSPTMFLDGEDMFFGNDRIPLLQARIEAG